MRLLLFLPLLLINLSGIAQIKLIYKEDEVFIKRDPFEEADHFYLLETLPSKGVVMINEGANAVFADNEGRLLVIDKSDGIDVNTIADELKKKPQDPLVADLLLRMNAREEKMILGGFHFHEQISLKTLYGHPFLFPTQIFVLPRSYQIVLPKGDNASLKVLNHVDQELPIIFKRDSVYKMDLKNLKTDPYFLVFHSQLDDRFSQKRMSKISQYPQDKVKMVNTKIDRIKSLFGYLPEFFVRTLMAQIYHEEKLYLDMMEIFFEEYLMNPENIFLQEKWMLFMDYNFNPEKSETMPHNDSHR